MTVSTTNNTALVNYLLQLGDNSLILSQRLAELCGHGPVIEQDIALTNIALDLLGEARSYLQYAGELSDKTEDELAFFRAERGFKNVLLVELASTDYAHTIVRQFFFSTHFTSCCWKHYCRAKTSASVPLQKSLIKKPCTM